MSPTPRPHVVTFSPQPSVADFLTRIAEAAGFAGRAASTTEELRTAVAMHAPDAIIYEVAFPFATSWRQLLELRREPALAYLPVVVTTPDARELHRRVGVTALELFRRPDDLSEVREAVLSAIQTAA